MKTTKADIPAGWQEVITGCIQRGDDLIEHGGYRRRGSAAAIFTGISIAAWNASGGTSAVLRRIPKPKTP